MLPTKAVVASRVVVVSTIDAALIGMGGVRPRSDVPSKGAAPIAAVISLVAVLAGCADFPLYSEARDQQGQAARKAWSEVDVKGKIAVARENIAALLDRELATADKLVLARRDQMVRSMATGGTIEDQLVKPTARSLQRLAGSPALAQAWVDAWEAQELAAQAVADAAQEMADAGVEMPSCDDISGNKPEAMQPLMDHVANGGQKGSDVDQALSAARGACANPKLKGSASVDVGGSIAITRAQVGTAAAALAAARATTRNERNAYKAALDAHEKAVADLQTDPQAQEKVRAAAAKLRKTVEVLEKAADVFSEQFLSEQRLDSLNRFLSVVADTKSGEAPPEGASRAAVALVLFSQLADDTRKALADAKSPNLVPLVLQKNHQRIKLDAATRDVAAREAVVSVRQQKLALQTKQAEQYLRAAEGFDRGNRRFHAMTLETALAEAEEPKRKQADPAKEREARAARASLRDEQNGLLRAVGLYLDTEGRLRSEIRKTDTRVNAMAHERALAYAEANTAQWESLISSGVDQLAAYGASGIKAEKITALLNSLTLLWIGAGVQ